MLPLYTVYNGKSSKKKLGLKVTYTVYSVIFFIWGYIMCQINTKSYAIINWTFNILFSISYFSYELHNNIQYIDAKIPALVMTGYMKNPDCQWLMWVLKRNVIYLIDYLNFVSIFIIYHNRYILKKSLRCLLLLFFKILWTNRGIFYYCTKEALKQEKNMFKRLLQSHFSTLSEYIIIWSLLPRLFMRHRCN